MKERCSRVRSIVRRSMQIATRGNQQRKRDRVLNKCFANHCQKIPWPF